MARNLAAALRLLVVTDDRLLAGRDPLESCRDAVSGGATGVQLRLKQASDRELLRAARRLVTGLPVPVFINDRLDVALAAGAAGVHLGPDDLPPARARAMVPEGFWIGASVGDPDEAHRGAAADYWGIGPYRVTQTKVDAGSALGIDGARRLLSMAGGRPCVAIGGITPDDRATLREAGFCGVAVASGILGADDVRAAAARYGDERR